MRKTLCIALMILPGLCLARETQRYAYGGTEYDISAHWLETPVFHRQATMIFTVESNGTPLDPPLLTATGTVMHETKTQAFPLRHIGPGAYAMTLIPNRAGMYAFGIIGTHQGRIVNAVFVCGNGSRTVNANERKEGYLGGQGSVACPDGAHTLQFPGDHDKFESENFSQNKELQLISDQISDDDMNRKLSLLFGLSALIISLISYLRIHHRKP